MRKIFHFICKTISLKELPRSNSFLKSSKDVAPGEKRTTSPCSEPAYAASRVSARAKKLEADCTQKLSEYFDRLVAAYQKHLQMLIAQRESDKAEMTSQLSEEERILQNDSDWLDRFSEFVKKVERD